MKKLYFALDYAGNPNILGSFYGTREEADSHFISTFEADYMGLSGDSDIIQSKEDMQKVIMGIVDQICNAESTNCRNLNKADMARELMNLANIPQSADIQEIPLDWNNQVVVLFLLPDDKNYYSLFAGIGNDGKFYFELSITGILLGNGHFDFFETHGEKEQILSIDYFLNQKEKKMEERNLYIVNDSYNATQIYMDSSMTTVFEDEEKFLYCNYTSVNKEFYLVEKSLIILEE